ncbi:PLANT INVERTASE/PECTIN METHYLESTERASE INHIBITOR SUPERFAMILY PROTEIN [Salix viminalis]|uniref:PLANT INVERTASE/PECTIN METHYLESTERASE INHIBITOR SUPERFAMILY PROTEIN n=1 Tax=Salix viminalis TaxID=40686 RepID=A0A9Q0NUL6_SALVM|nr:PLANT INVERTASE/PECTIN METHYLESTERASE INHIBITOR SUPERFAMILY PROTEIN [Salix viminalis]
MAKPIILLLAALSILYTASPANAATTSSPSSSSAIDFIEASCSATLYPALCVQSLSRYATSIRRNRSQLIQTAFSVSLDEAQSTKAIFANKLINGVKPGGMAVVKDCLEQIGDAVDQLRESIEELKNIGQAKGVGQELEFHISNVQKWTSAALTDLSTCTDAVVAGEALDGGLETSVRARMDGAARVTSNALALFNRFGTELKVFLGI